MTTALPAGVLLAFYGDDFTGSTDAMEVMAFAGLKTVLFTRTPSAPDLSRFRDYQVVGIAGTARARTPEWMEENLPPAFEVLKALKPQIVHYKVCSTFDSAPDVGSIGRAIDLGMASTGSTWSPSIVGAPQLRRWQVFANLFANANGVRYRIDRHPTMSRHPVTPMREADLRLHLRQQTARKVEAIDIIEMRGAKCQMRIDAAIDDGEVLFLDVADETTQATAGRLVWENRGKMLFTASSSGLQYALVSHWTQIGSLEPAGAPLHAARPVEKLLVLSGSCSPVTADQIAHAEANGFASLRIDVRSCVDLDEQRSESARIAKKGAEILSSGQSLVVYTAKTVDDEAFIGLKSHCETIGIDFSEGQARIGDALGAVASELIRSTGVKRLLVAGGDTSGRVLETLPVFALEAVHPMATGSPICRVYSDDEAFDGLQVILKGGQVGSTDLFSAAREGRDARV